MAGAGTPSAPGIPGQQGLTDAGSKYNATAFAIDQKLGQVMVALPVKIIAVHGGGIGAAPTVDVMPMVNQTDGTGGSTPHSTIYGIQTHRSQGGQSVVINDPKVGDIGHVVVAHRDISAVKSTGKQSNPGSFRRHDMADGIYHGSLGLAGQETPSTPTKYVWLSDPDGLTVADDHGNKIETRSGHTTITTAELRVTGNVIVGYGGGDQVNIQTHVHSGIVPGSSNTQAPVPGS